MRWDVWHTIFVIVFFLIGCVVGLAIETPAPETVTEIKEVPYLNLAKSNEELEKDVALLASFLNKKVVSEDQAQKMIKGLRDEIWQKGYNAGYEDGYKRDKGRQGF